MASHLGLVFGGTRDCVPWDAGSFKRIFSADEMDFSARKILAGGIFTAILKPDGIISLCKEACYSGVYTLVVVNETRLPCSQFSFQFAF